jgi:phospholipase C
VAASACISSPRSPATGIDKIRHVVVIMQENRSFDSYFGTYPGADGIPMKHDAPSVCVPDPVRGSCQRPYHDPNLVNIGGPHNEANARADVHGGAMDGFIGQAERGRLGCLASLDPRCSGRGAPDVMGYHDAREIPNYWRYAHDFVLQDHLFEPAGTWSLPAHLFMVSGWSARCSSATDPESCRTALGFQLGHGSTQNRVFPWTDLTYLLDRAHVSWRYYVAAGTEPDCRNGTMFCNKQGQMAGTPSIWNPLPRFDTVRSDEQVGDVQSAARFFVAARGGTLPSVSWVVPNGRDSEHPPSSIANGQAWVTRAIDAVMRGPDWDSTAIFLAWDDWGGFYDHVSPPSAGPIRYGLRVPGLVISPYARRGYVDHQVLSFDSYLRFIEDDFLGGARLDPATDGRPDSRPVVRETSPLVGDLRADFDFSRPPRRPVILPPRP